MQTKLISAILSGQEDDVLACLKSGEDPNQTDLSGKTALIIAVSSPGVSDKIVLALLDHGADLFGVSNDELSALWYASGEGGDSSRLKVLLDRGAIAHEIDSNGCTAVVQACLCGDVERLRLLVEHGGSVQMASIDRHRFKFDESDLVPMFAAVKSGSLDCVRYLESHGVPISFEYGRHSVLNYVGSVEVGQYFIDESNRSSTLFPQFRDIDSDWEWDFLYETLKDGSLYLAEAMLLQFTTNRLAIVNAHLYSVCRDDNLDAVKMLLRLGADPNKTLDSQGNQPWGGLTWNSTCKNLKPILVELIKHGFDVNQPNDKGDPPLVTTAKGEYGYHLTRALLERGATVDGQDAKGKTALMIAVGRWDDHIVELLLDHGASPDLRDNSRKSAIDYAKANYRNDFFFSKLFRSSYGESKKTLDLLESYRINS